MADGRWIFSLLFCCAFATASAQTPAVPGSAVIIPPPPKVHGAAGQRDHQARLVAPGRAYDDVTGARYTWSCTRKTWVDDRTHQEIGFDGFQGPNGEIIPPPEPNYGTGVQPVQSSSDPAHAVDVKTGTDLRWDSVRRSWQNTKTGQYVRAQGWVMASCPQNVKLSEPLTSESVNTAELSKKFDYDDEPLYEFRLDFEHRNYINWKEVTGSVPNATSAEGSTSANGFGLSSAFNPWSFPLYIGVSGYCGFGLSADVKLSNGHRSTSDVTDCGAAVEFRLYAPISAPVQPYVQLGGLWFRNFSTYKEFNTAGAQIFSEKRDLASFAGTYSGGLVYWPNSTIGIDVGVGYYGKFKSTNADENIRLSTGLILRLGNN
jgi:hypothetical protein